MKLLDAIKAVLESENASEWSVEHAGVKLSYSDLNATDWGCSKQVTDQETIKAINYLFTDESIPKDEVHFKKDGKVLGKIVNLKDYK